MLQVVNIYSWFITVEIHLCPTVVYSLLNAYCWQPCPGNADKQIRGELVGSWWWRRKQAIRVKEIGRHDISLGLAVPEHLPVCICPPHPFSRHRGPWWHLCRALLWTALQPSTWVLISEYTLGTEEQKGFFFLSLVRTLFLEGQDVVFGCGWWK